MGLGGSPVWGLELNLPVALGEVVERALRFQLGFLDPLVSNFAQWAVFHRRWGPLLPSVSVVGGLGELPLRCSGGRTDCLH